jgi:hypothetical protein
MTYLNQDCCYFQDSCVVVGPGQLKPSVDDSKLEERQKHEEKRLAIMAMTKKRRRLYDKIMYSRKRKRSEVWKHHSCYALMFVI